MGPLVFYTSCSPFGISKRFASSLCLEILDRSALNFNFVVAHSFIVRPTLTLFFFLFPWVVLWLLWSPEWLVWFWGQFKLRALVLQVRTVTYSVPEDVFNWELGILGLKVTPYSCLARGGWVLNWRECAQFSYWWGSVPVILARKSRLLLGWKVRLR